MLIFSVSFQFFRMSPRRGHKQERKGQTARPSCAFCWVDWVMHVTKTFSITRGTVSWVNINVGHYDNTDSSNLYDAQSAWSQNVQCHYLPKCPSDSVRVASGLLPVKVAPPGMCACFGDADS